MLLFQYIDKKCLGKLAEAVRALNEFPEQIGMRPAIVQLRVALLLALDRKKVAFVIFLDYLYKRYLCSTCVSGKMFVGTLTMVIYKLLPDRCFLFLSKLHRNFCLFG